MRIASWNVNGLRSLPQPDWLHWLETFAPDILCLQEVRLQPHQLDLTLRHPLGYRSCWAHAAQAGYSGVGIYTRQEPQRIQVGLGQERYDIEGRVLLAEYPDFTVLSVYVPSGANGRSQWFYKMAFLHTLLDYVTLLQTEGKPLILGGDFNIAHQEIDVARPLRVAGFMAEERDWVSELLERGFVDSLRHLYPAKTGLYSWWSQRAGLREANRGWRLDYLFVSQELVPRLQAAGMQPEVTGSDHCPIYVDLSG